MAKQGENQINEFLVDFGLTEREINLYLTLLKTGPNTIMNLARETGIKRSTTHNNVEELIKKGLVSQTNFGERRMVVAEDPGKLKFLMEQKKWGVQKMEENLPDVISSITALVPEAKEKNKVEIKYYEGITGAGLIYEEALTSNELRSYVNLAKVLDTLPDNGKLFIEALNKNNNLKIWEILDNSEVSKEYTPEFAKSKNYKYKFTSKSLELSALDILIYDGKVAIITIGETVSGSVITNQEYYKNNLAIFNFIWGML